MLRHIKKSNGHINNIVWQKIQQLTGIQWASVPISLIFTLTTLNSDHVPILIKLGNALSMACLDPPQRAFTSLRKADWESFTREKEVEFVLMKPLFSCSSGTKTLRCLITNASIKHIPRGHVPNNLIYPTGSNLFYANATVCAHAHPLTL